MAGKAKLTLGQSRVRVDFNASGSDAVNQVKIDVAKLIDQMNDLKGDGSGAVNGELVRLVSLAQTAFEEAAMWAVKALTFK